MGNGQRQPQSMRMTAEQMEMMREMERQMKLEMMPPQVDMNGMERQCVFCHGILNPLRNSNYDGSTGGFCSKLCAADYEKRLMIEGMGEGDAAIEVDKYEEWRPKRHSQVV